MHFICASLFLLIEIIKCSFVSHVWRCRCCCCWSVGVIHLSLYSRLNSKNIIFKWNNKIELTTCFFFFRCIWLRLSNKTKYLFMSSILIFVIIIVCTSMHPPWHENIINFYTSNYNTVLQQSFSKMPLNWKFFFSSFHIFYKFEIMDILQFIWWFVF